MLSLVKLFWCTFQTLRKVMTPLTRKLFFLQIRWFSVLFSKNSIGVHNGGIYWQIVEHFLVIEDYEIFKLQLERGLPNWVILYGKTPFIPFYLSVYMRTQHLSMFSKKTFKWCWSLSHSTEKKYSVNDKWKNILWINDLLDKKFLSQ